MRQSIRIFGAVLLGAGMLGLAWAFVVWQWQDPLTALYSTYQQHRLSASYERTFAAYKPAAPAKFVVSPHAKKHEPNVRAEQKPNVRAEQRLIALDAKRYRKTLKPGQALGRLRVPRLDLSIIVVTGTDSDSLTKGPGWYTGTYLPGQGQLIYIAGHRTTYLAPFAHIEELRRGDTVRLELPYATFIYRVTTHVVVPSNDLARLKSHGVEVIALQACHPRFFATHRYIAYAKPTRVIPRIGTPFSVDSHGRAEAA